MRYGKRHSDRPQILRTLLIAAATILASATAAWQISSAVATAQHQSVQAHRQAAQAQAQACYETNRLLWFLDRASYAGYQRDKNAAAYLRRAAQYAEHHGATTQRLASTFQAAARDAYWQPLTDCTRQNFELQAAAPVDQIPQRQMLQLLTHPPTPPATAH